MRRDSDRARLPGSPKLVYNLIIEKNHTIGLALTEGGSTQISLEGNATEMYEPKISRNGP